MRFPDRTPTVVRRAVRQYVALRRVLWLTSILAGGGAVVGCLLFGALLADRFAEWDATWRAVWPWLVRAGLFATGLSALGYLFRYRPRALGVAVGLDQALPELEDRWASSIDLAGRQEAGEDVGAPACVERLLRETEATTSARGVARVLRLKYLGFAGAALAFTGMLFLLLSASSAFDLPLLWQRFWNPRANLARDSFTVIRILDSSGSPWTGKNPEPLPEGSPFSISVALERKASWFAPTPDVIEPIIPQVEIVAASGRREVRELGRSGDHWRFRLPRLKEPFRFRLRADDGLTAWHQQQLVPRIRLAKLIHSISYPKYARLQNVKRQPLDAKRLAVLAGTRVEFELSCDNPAKSIDVSFELLQQSKQDKDRVLSRDELLEIGRPSPKPKGTSSSRRVLKVRRRGEKSGRFRLQVDETGVLRLRALGENGLYSHERVILMEALPDAPPRVSIAGIETNSTILPGEALAYQFRVEDDYAVADLVMEWTSAGWAPQENLTGEEYIALKDIGKKVVVGQELIQRMDYYVYGTAPFQFRLVAIDSKGQEARTPLFNIHIIDDDFTARFDRGMQYLQRCREGAAGYGGFHGRLKNRLNIIIKATAGQKKWPAAQNSLLEAYLKDARYVSHGFGYSQFYQQRFGGFPHRLDRSAALLSLPHLLLANEHDVRALAEKLHTTADLPTLLDGLRTMHDQNYALAQLWAQAVALEVQRFQPEGLLHKARKLQSRYASLAMIRHNRQLHAANLAFYSDELAKLLAEARTLKTPPLNFSAEVKRLHDAHAGKDARAVQSALAGFTKTLSAYRPPPAPALAKLMAALQQQAALDPVARDRFEGAAGEFIRACGQQSLFAPFEILALGDGTQGKTAAAGNWQAPPIAIGELWLLLDHLRQDLAAHRIDMLVGRHDRHPGAARDRDAWLRERLLATAELATRCPKLDRARREQVASLLRDAAAEPLSVALVKPDKHLPERFNDMLAAFGPATISADQVLLPKRREHLAGALERLAQAFEAHARGCRALAGDLSGTGEVAATARRGQVSRDAARLMNRAEGLEAYARALIFLCGQQKLQDPRVSDWQDLAPLHGLQLAMTFAAVRAQEHVAARHGKELPNTPGAAKQNLQIIATGAENLAGDLRLYAGLCRQVLQGQKTSFDFDALMKQSKARGYLRTLKEEFEFVSPLLRKASEAAKADVRKQLGHSRLGKVAAHERLLLGLLPTVNALKQRQATNAGATLAQLKNLAGPMPSLGLADLATEHQTLIATLQALPPEQSLSAALERRLSVFARQVTEASDELRGGVRLEQSKATNRMNRRATTSRGMPNLWIIQGIVDGYDRRWVAFLRDTELSLVRELAARVLPDGPGPAHAKSLALQYGRMLELRARNLANERRRNRGIAFLGGGSGPTLRLPKHIAAEFYKARNLKAPAAFKEWSEAYYQALHKDLSD